jgi:hypothetical protein
MRKQLKHVKPGQRITDGQYNALVDRVNELLSLSVGPGLNLSQGYGGAHISLGLTQKIWLFEITSDTPTAATGGDRYWAASRVRLDTTPTWAASTPTGYNLFDPVYDNGRNMVHLDGDRVTARFNDETGRWEMIQANCLMRLGKINQIGGIAKGATGTVDIYSGSILAEVIQTGISVTAGNKHNPNIANAKWVYIRHVEGTGWYIMGPAEV